MHQPKEDTARGRELPEKRQDNRRKLQTSAVEEIVNKEDSERDGA